MTKVQKIAHKLAWGIGIWLQLAIIAVMSVIMYFDDSDDFDFAKKPSTEQEAKEYE